MKQESFIDEIKRVPDEVVKKLIGGASIADCAIELKSYEVYSVIKISELKELIYTAYSLALNEQLAKDVADFCKMYEIISAGDQNVCEKCQKKDGKRHRLDKRKAGVNFPPFHLGCKCAVIFE